MPQRLAAPARLFHAVVITGAALANACGNEAEPNTPSSPHGEGDGAGGNTGNGSAKDANASDGDIQLRPTDGGAGGRDACPDGSDMPYPPCYYIR